MTGHDLPSRANRRLDPTYLREKAKAEAMGLFCYWAVRELGYSMLEIAGRLGMSQTGVVYAVNRGERIATERDFELTHRVS